MFFWVNIGGILLAALSIFKLVHRTFEFGLAPIFAEFMAFYSQVLTPFAAFVNAALAWCADLIGWQVPHFSEEVVVLYFLLGGSLVRGASANEGEGLGPFAIPFVIGWPVVVLLMALSAFFSDLREIMEVVQHWAWQMVLTVMASIALFAMNAYGVGAL